jgi:nitrate reductase gamma subunit
MVLDAPRPEAASMRILLAVATYFGYIFIIVMYSAKLVKYLNLPMHLRSEVYPVIPGDQTSQERSYYEASDWWTRSRRHPLFRRAWFLFSDYFFLGEYFRREKGYWLFLYPWHMGFILIITFHILCFFGALASMLGIPVAYGSPSLVGNAIFGMTLATGVVSFISGLFGSMGILIRRLADKNLRIYATPQNYFTYLLLLAVFLSGLYSWYVDPVFAIYRNFWKGLITLKPVNVEPATATHILLFAFLLIYLPFTRSLHYITRLFGFLLIRWDDRPNLRGSALEKEIEEMLNLKISWSGPHIKPDLTWREIASEAIVTEKK